MKKQLTVTDLETGTVDYSKTLEGNRDFVMNFRPYMKYVRLLIEENHIAAALLQLLIEKMDKQNSIAVSRKALSEIMGVSERTIDRKTAWLKNAGYIEVFKMGTSRVYCVNSSIAWTTYGNNLKYARFTGEIMLSASEQRKLDDAEKKIHTSFNKEMTIKAFRYLRDVCAEEEEAA